MTSTSGHITPSVPDTVHRIRGNGGLYASFALLAFACFLYGDLLVSRSNVVVSHVFGDTCGAFVGWRRFGFGELAKGNLPLWNPYVFCGAPFAGNMQSAMFYPVNALLYLTLPLANAINAEIMFHTLLAGFSTLAWVRNRGAGWMPSVVAAAVVMAGAPVSMRLNLGQLNVIAVFAWLPLTLLAVDKLLERISPGWILAGILAVSMQLVAGYPPSVYNNAFAVAVYCILRLARHPNRLRTTGALLVVATAPVLIAAAPIATAYHTTRESLRAEGTSLEFASSWSLPIENLLTAITPLFFGDYTHVNYWGRWCLWDVCVFIGVGSLFLLVYGAAYAPRNARLYAGAMLVILLLTALGRYTPFFTALYYVVPGLGSFRAPSKFLLPALVFAAMLVGLGADAFVKGPRRTGRFALVAISIAVCLAAAGIGLQSFPSILDRPNGLWTALVAGVEQSGEAYWWFEMDDAAMDTSVWIASMSAFVGAGACIATAFLMHRSRSSRNYRIVLLCFSAIEVLVFARYIRVTTDIDTLTSEALTELRENDRGDYRELQAKSINPNWRRNFPVDIGMKTAWGYDPVMLRRYAEFFAFALGGEDRQDYLVNDVILTNILDPISVSVMTGIFRFEFEPPDGETKHRFVKMPPLFRLTRCKYVYFWPEPVDGILGGIEGVYQVRGPLPRFSIYRDYVVAPNNRAALESLTEAGFDLEHALVLEGEPEPAPSTQTDESRFSSERITVTDESTDYVELEVELAAAGILFITDAYSNGWKAAPLPGSEQRTYEIVPANHAFQAIPLGAGHHRIRLEYAPAIVAGGMWVSSIGTLGYVSLCLGWAVWQLRRRGPTLAGAN